MQNNIETNINVEFNNNEKEISDIVKNNTNIENRNMEQAIDITKNNKTNEKNNLIQDFLEMIKLKLQQTQQQENQEQMQQGFQQEFQQQEGLEHQLESEKQEQQIQNQNTEQQILEIQEEKTLVIDRFEGNIAVCENRETLEMENIEISNLPQNIKEGDVIKSKNNQYELDAQSKLEIEERIKNKMKNLFND